jgi:hypothetical protein
MRAYKNGREAMEEAADSAVEPDDEPDGYEDDMPALGGMEQPSDDSGGAPESDPETDSEADEAEEEYKVQEIVDSRVRGGVAQYKVKWEGYDKPTWEPAESLQDTEALDRWEQQQPADPEPPRRSARHAAKSGSESDDTELEFDDDGTGSSKMAMAMGAIRGDAHLQQSRQSRTICPNAPQPRWRKL